MLRGWIQPSRYLSDRLQKRRLIEATVEVIYSPSEGGWTAFVKSLRPEIKDHAVVADLRIFGSRKALVAAMEEIAGRDAKLVEVVSGMTELDAPTLRVVDKALMVWRGESAMKSRKRASELGKRGADARNKQVREQRAEKNAAGRIWRDIKRYHSVADALENMPGWSKASAYRAFGPREKPVPKPTSRRKA